MIIAASEDLEVVKSFDELGFRDELLRGKNIFYDEWQLTDKFE